MLPDDDWSLSLKLLIANLLLAVALTLCAQTAQDQSNAKPDVETTRMIRREITKTKGMSTNARNVKIITASGIVTLKGNVQSADEKAKVEAIAKKNAGSNTVKSELEIAN